MKFYFVKTVSVICALLSFLSASCSKNGDTTGTNGNTGTTDTNGNTDNKIVGATVYSSCTKIPLR